MSFTFDKKLFVITVLGFLCVAETAAVVANSIAKSATVFPAMSFMKSGSEPALVHVQDCNIVKAVYPGGEEIPMNVQLKYVDDNKDGTYSLIGEYAKGDRYIAFEVKTRQACGRM